MYQFLLTVDLEDNCGFLTFKKELLDAGKVIPENRYKERHHSKDSHQKISRLLVSIQNLGFLGCEQYPAFYWT